MGFLRIFLISSVGLLQSEDGIRIVMEVLNIVLKKDGTVTGCQAEENWDSLEYSIKRATEEGVYIIAKSLCTRFQCVTA